MSHSVLVSTLDAFWGQVDCRTSARPKINNNNSYKLQLHNKNKKQNYTLHLN